MGSELNTRQCCKGFISPVISLGLTGLCLWLGLRTQEPKCSIESLYVPSLTSTPSHHNHNNATIVFQLSLANPNDDKGVRYDAIHFSFALFLNTNTTRPFANDSLPAFYQGHGKTAKKWGSAEARDRGVSRTAAKVDGKVFFRVDFATKVKYKVFLFFYTKWHLLNGGANVDVNFNTGEKVNPKGIRLGAVPPVIMSEAGQVRRSFAGSLGVFVITGLVIIAFT